MKKLLLTTLLFSFAIIVFAQDQTTFILVRHAEKADDGTRNPPLNEDGKTRSANLAEMLVNQEIAGLYSTPFKRTQETLQPIASMKNLEVQDYDPYAKGEWLATLAEKHSGGTVVISGHSNTIPALANALLGSENFSQFDESDYSNLIIIVADEVGKGKLVRLKF
ncbi:phosphoglycerate mutase family protein [Ekhidna sp. To15]|uniref:phosphoglycerate mutase family protein n=1 Tax=Ekhidna sp. To15 TaxID=3395267 RepID=UPI003F51E112